MGTSAPPRHVCFFAQQAVEKAIKSILVYLQVEFPKSHDLEALANLMPSEWTVTSRVPDLAALTEWAVEARYPGDWPEATTEDAEYAVTLASEVLEVTEGDFRARGLAP
jgi:HEPN domain-containing protein